jgi:hypothetical protein
LAFARRTQSYGRTPSIPRRNFVDLKLDNIGRATVAGERASLDGSRALTVRLRSDGAGTLRLDVPLPAGATVERTEGPAVSGASAARSTVRAAASAPEVDLSRTGASFRVASGTRVYVIRPAASSSGSGGAGGENGSGNGGGPGGDGSGGTAGASGGGGGSLPFTGLAAALLVAVGLSLVAAGRVVRRRA